MLRLVARLEEIFLKIMESIFATFMFHPLPIYVSNAMLDLDLILKAKIAFLMTMSEAGGIA